MNNNQCIVIGNAFPTDYKTGRIHSTEGICPTISYNGGTVVLIGVESIEFKLYFDTNSNKDDKNNE